MDGVVVVDKPAGVGSTDVVRVVRRAAGQRRVGHTGTLDPQATGVLVVCLGRATRLVRFLQEGTKVYRADVVFGIETTTQDAAGEIVAERSAADVTEERLRRVLPRFTGEIEQVPPMVSAVKVGGERLYHKARRGEEVERPSRRVTVHALEIEDFHPGERAAARLAVTCSSGTYVRTLAHDVGGELGCGASLTALRRVRNGEFSIADAHDLETLEDLAAAGDFHDAVLGLDDAVRGLPQVAVDADGAAAVANGRPLPARGAPEPFAVVADSGRLLAVYADRDGAARPEVVLVQPADLPDADPPGVEGTSAGG